MKKRRAFLWLIIGLVALFALAACGEKTEPISADAGDSIFVTPRAKETIRIVSGSENQELEHLIQTFVDQHQVNVVIDYLGSVDIMNMLQSGNVEYDAVWPANSMWVTMGDKNRLVKHMKSTSITPIVLGIRQSKAQELGYGDGKATVDELIADITEGSLRFTMTSATQSNSGAAAYIGFLYALSGSPDILTMDSLNDPSLRDRVVTLLSGVERSSGSSGWLKDLFVRSNYDAMINYEALIIAANKELDQAGKEPMQVVYLENGTSIADSPLVM